MTDQCQHCTVRGDFENCLKTKCFHHENWISDQWRAEDVRLKAENAELLEVLETLCGAIADNLNTDCTCAEDYTIRNMTDPGCEYCHVGSYILPTTEKARAAIAKAKGR